MEKYEPGGLSGKANTTKRKTTGEPTASSKEIVTSPMLHKGSNSIAVHNDEVIDGPGQVTSKRWAYEILYGEQVG